jgi:dihydropteroate synthase-like protein
MPEPESAADVMVVTGRLAERLVRQVTDDIARQTQGSLRVVVVPISVAALCHVDWLLRKLPDAWPADANISRVILPGWCQGELSLLSERFGVPFERGPIDIRDLPAHLGLGAKSPVTLDAYDIEILAEINHAPRMSEHDVVSLAARYRDHGADVIDVGTVPGETCQRVGDIVALLKREGHRVSIDSFDRREVEAAVAAGAELVLSCQRGNIDWTSRLGVEVVAIPDLPDDADSLDDLAARLDALGVRYRLDPILEPVGVGFARSFARYFDVRRRHPGAAVMMGIGNVTELAETDSAPLSLLLAGACQELGIQSVLTTEVAAWCRSAVREFELARRIARAAVDRGMPMKSIDSGLLMLRDRKEQPVGQDVLDEWSRSIKDPNFRIIVERGEIHILNRDGYWRGTDAFELFDRFTADSAPLDAPHAFYLGYELAKAVTALTLGKRYVQDEALHWGILTAPEASAHERRRKQRSEE